MFGSREARNFGIGLQLKRDWGWNWVGAQSKRQQLDTFEIAID
jgi:hypothetical protein